MEDCRLGGRREMLRAHILNHNGKEEKSRDLKGSGSLNSVSVPSDVLLGGLHPFNLPTQCHQLGPSVPMPEAAGGIFHSDHCMEALEKDSIIDRASPRNRC